MTQDRVLRLLKRHSQLRDKLQCSAAHPCYDLVLGAGGVKGYAEIGAFQAIIDLNIKIRKKRGVSVGAGNALLIDNGFTPREMFELYERERERLFDAAVWQSFYVDSMKAFMGFMSGDFSSQPMFSIYERWQRKLFDTALFWQQALTIPSPMQWMKSQSFITLEQLWKAVIDKEQLVASDNLEIVTHCMKDGEAVFFKGKACNPLHKTVAASGSLPGVFVPVEHEEHLLGDGAMFHYNPTNGLKEPAIVIRLGRATQWPSEPLTFLDAYYLWREIHLPMMPTTQDVDTDKHVVVDIPCSDVAGLAFGISQATRWGLVEEGYRVTYETLKEEIAKGRIIVPKAA